MFTLEFKAYATLSDGEIDLKLSKRVQGDRDKLFVPAYHFDISLAGRPEVIGRIDLRIGYTNDLVWYGGHIGYNIAPAYRGHRYAAKACRRLKPVAIEHQLDVLWITCNPENWASRKTCEYVGCELVDIVTLPEDNEMYRRGERQKCRYRWLVY